MKISVQTERENPLLKRKELEGIIEHDGMSTPSKAAVQKYLAQERDAKEKHIEIRQIFSSKGREYAKLRAYIWDEKEVPVLAEKTKEAAKDDAKTEEKKEEPAKSE